MWKAVEIDAWIAGRQSSLEDVRATVTEIIGRVQTEGDAALIDLAKKHCVLTDIAVSDDEREDAYEKVDAKIIESLIEAHARIERFHELQKPRDLWLQEMEPGIVLGVKTTPFKPSWTLYPRGAGRLPVFRSHVCGTRPCCRSKGDLRLFTSSNQTVNPRCTGHRRGN